MQALGTFAHLRPATATPPEGLVLFTNSMHERYTIDTSKTTQFSDAWVFLGVILCVAALILQNLYLSIAGATLLVVAGITWLWNALSLRALRYDRNLSETRAFPGEVLTLTLSVNNHKPLPLTWLIVRDLFPSGIPVDGRELVINPATNLVDFTTFWMPGANQKISRTFRLRCIHRGYYRFGPATIETGDGFGFFESRGVQRVRGAAQRVDASPDFAGAGVHAPADDEALGEIHLIIYPRIYTVAELRLPARNPFGNLRSRSVLHEDPMRIAGVREWQPDDDIRRIHWMASARQQELVSRNYEPSEEQQVLIFLNVATLERHWQGVMVELLERVISVSGSIAALALAERVSTGIVANAAIPGSDREVRLLPGRSPNQLMHILELLAGVTPFATMPIEELLQREATRLPAGATLVVVTAIAHDELLATMQEIADAGRRVVLITLAEAPPTQWLRRVEVWHLPHLVDDVVVPEFVDTSA